MSTRRKIIKDNELYNNKSTKATHFLLPFYGWGKSYYTDYLITVNIISDENKPRIVFIFDNFDEDGLVTQLYKLHNHHCFDESWEDDEGKEICVSMKIPQEYLKDYKLFLEGKYSKFSERYKDILVKIYGRTVNPIIEVNLKGEKSYSKKAAKVSMFETLYPTYEKRRAIERRLEVTLDENAEVFDKVNLEEEEYLSIVKLKEKYGVK